MLPLGNLSQGVDYDKIVPKGLSTGYLLSQTIQSHTQVETYVFLEPGEVTAYIVRYIEFSHSVAILANGRYDAAHQVNPPDS